MRIVFRSSFAAIWLAATVGCSGTVDPAAARASLLEADRAWASAAAAGDIEKVKTFWSDDAVNFFPGRPPAHGKEQIGELVKRNRSIPGFSLTWDPDRAVVSDSGDLGYTYGSFRVSRTGPDGNPVQREGNYVEFWRRQPDGTWKCEVETTIFSE